MESYCIFVSNMESKERTMTAKNHIKSEEAQKALDSIRQMEQAGLKRILPASRWLAGALALLIGTQIALLGAGIRNYNTLIIVLIVIMVIAIFNNNRSSGVTERIVLPVRAKILLMIGLILTYFSSIIAGQFLKNTLGYDWAPFAIGVIVVLGFWALIMRNHRSYSSKFHSDKP